MWSLQACGLYIQVVFRAGLTVYMLRENPIQNHVC